MCKLLCLSLLIAIIGSAQIIEAAIDKPCSNNPADWCKNVYEAEACNLVEHCWKYVWSESGPKPLERDADLVNLTLYYETLCPDCRQFMSTQLWQAYQSVSAILNLTLVPYGNAKETWRNETKLWQFTCQHGGDECWANQLHTCMIFYYPKTDDHLPFIHCMETNDKDDVHTAAQKCAQQFNVSMGQLDKCMSSRLGNYLEHEMAARTEVLDPPHKYVPWVTLNGVHTEEIEQKAEKDLVGLICETYTGKTKPDACSGLLTKRKCLNDL